MLNGRLNTVSKHDIRMHVRKVNKWLVVCLALIVTATCQWLTLRTSVYRPFCSIGSKFRFWAMWNFAKSRWQLLTICAVFTVSPRCCNCFHLTNIIPRMLVSPSTPSHAPPTSHLPSSICRDLTLASEKCKYMRKKRFTALNLNQFKFKCLRT